MRGTGNKCYKGETEGDPWQLVSFEKFSWRKGDSCCAESAGLKESKAEEIPARQLRSKVLEARAKKKGLEQVKSIRHANYPEEQRYNLGMPLRPEDRRF